MKRQEDHILLWTQEFSSLELNPAATKPRVGFSVGILPVTTWNEVAAHISLTQPVMLCNAILHRLFTGSSFFSATDLFLQRWPLAARLITPLRGECLQSSNTFWTPTSLKRFMTGSSHTSWWYLYLVEQHMCFFRRLLVGSFGCVILRVFGITFGCISYRRLNFVVTIKGVIPSSTLPALRRRSCRRWYYILTSWWCRIY